MLRPEQSLPAHLLTATRISFAHARTRPGLIERVTLELPEGLSVSSLDVLLLRSREGVVSRNIEDVVGVLTVPIERGTRRGELAFVVPALEPAACDRACEAYALTGALANASSSEAEATTEDTLDVIVSPFVFGM